MRKRIRKLCSNLLTRSCGCCGRRSIVRCIVVGTWYSNLLYFGHVSRFLLGKKLFGICDLWSMYKTCERCCGHMWLGIRLSVVLKREHSRRFYGSPEADPLTCRQVECIVALSSSPLRVIMNCCCRPLVVQIAHSSAHATLCLHDQACAANMSSLPPL
jgi:hypothetical protein